MRSLPPRFKVDIRVKPGSHNSESACEHSASDCVRHLIRAKVNKQLNDKERVAAALENNALLEVVEQCLSTSGRRGQ